MKEVRKPTAVIADDERLMREQIAARLKEAWPELEIVGEAANGREAVALVRAREPDVVFLDIRMPEMDGIEAARALAGQAHVVFVTAYDEYALQAFDRAAIDYVLKPVQPERLAQTCARLQSALAQRGGNALAATIEQLRSLLVPPPSAPAAERLNMLPVGVGNEVRMVPVASVIYFEAADKYVRVVTAEREYLIRVSLRELLPQLDPQAFWQIHRGTVVRADAVASALRDESGKLTLTLAGHPDRLTVSRLYAQRFKAL